MEFKSKRERIAFVIMVTCHIIIICQVILFSLSRRYEIDDFSRCLMEACNGEFLNETVFWLSLCGAIISGSIAFAWETLYVPILSWIETGEGIHFEEKISEENILKNRINSIRVQSLSIRKCCDYILQNLVENAEQEKQLDLIYNVKNIKEKVFQLDDVMRDLEETCVFLIDSIIQAIEKKENPLSEENKNIIIRSKQIFTSSINDLMNDINFVRKFDEFRDTHFLLMGDSTKILGHASIILDDMNAILGNGSC